LRRSAQYRARAGSSGDAPPVTGTCRSMFVQVNLTRQAPLSRSPNTQRSFLSVIWSFRIDHGCDLGGCVEVGVVGAAAWSLRSRVSRVGSLPKSDAAGWCVAVLRQLGWGMSGGRRGLVRAGAAAAGSLRSESGCVPGRLPAVCGARSRKRAGVLGGVGMVHGGSRRGVVRCQRGCRAGRRARSVTLRLPGRRSRR
jgi:hypothetical protein